MSTLNPDNLTVEYREGVNERAPLIPRRYTFTNSEETHDSFLTIGPDFYYDKINTDRNDVLGEWLSVEDRFRFYVYLFIDERNETNMKNYYDRRLQDLVIALQAFRYGDQQFFNSHAELDQYPIIVYFLYDNPSENRGENWGTFAHYKIHSLEDYIVANSLKEYRALLDEKSGDVNGDGIPDKISVYGDRTPNSDFVYSIITEIKFGSSDLGVSMITELNGINPRLFLGDFTKDHIEDILFQMDQMFNAMDSTDKGEYGIAIYTIKDNHLETIFVSDMYNQIYPFLVEYRDNYKISIMNVKTNQLFSLDISNMGDEYLSHFYYENGSLKRPVQGKVQKAEAFIPIINNITEETYDLVAVHRIIGSFNNETLGFIENQLSWDGKRFISVNIQAATTGIDLIA